MAGVAPSRSNFPVWRRRGGAARRSTTGSLPGRGNSRSLPLSNFPPLNLRRPSPLFDEIVKVTPTLRIAMNLPLAAIELGLAMARAANKDEAGPQWQVMLRMT